MRVLINCKEKVFINYVHISLKLEISYQNQNPCCYMYVLFSSLPQILKIIPQDPSQLTEMNSIFSPNNPFPS